MEVETTLYILKGLLRGRVDTTIAGKFCQQEQIPSHSDGN